jgi:MTH538 TIR-like domain (DUF1863)
VNFLDRASRFYWKDYSISVDNPRSGGSRKKLASEIERNVRLASVVLVIAGIEVSYREWLQFEIDLADKYNKPLIGIRPRGKVRLPLAVQQSAVEIVSWNGNSIIKAIIRNVD